MGQFNGRYIECRVSAPSVNLSNGRPWPQVKPSDWCSHWTQTDPPTKERKRLTVVHKS